MRSNYLPTVRKPQPSVSKSIKNALTNESFIEKVAVLLVTAVLSGIFVPLIVSTINSKNQQLQKERDAAKTKQEALLQSRIKLLDDFSEVAITLETLALDVSWFESPNAKNKDLAGVTFQRYSDRSVDLVTKWRVLSSRSRLLASGNDCGDRMDALLLRIFRDQDGPMNRLHNDHASDELWAKQHEINIQMLGETNNMIEGLADSLGLPVRKRVAGEG